MAPAETRERDNHADRQYGEMSRGAGQYLSLNNVMSSGWDALQEDSARKAKGRFSREATYIPTSRCAGPVTGWVRAPHPTVSAQRKRPARPRVRRAGRAGCDRFGSRHNQGDSQSSGGCNDLIPIVERQPLGAVKGGAGSTQVTLKGKSAPTNRGRAFVARRQDR